MKATELVKLRKRFGLNQTEFWSAVEVSQSGGSRYETGRPLPRPVQALVKFVYYGEAPLRWSRTKGKFVNGSEGLK